MACGLPVIAYDLPAYEFFHNESFTTVPPGDIAAFSKAASTILADSNLLTRIRPIAEEWARKFRWSTVVDEDLSYMNLTT